MRKRQDVLACNQKGKLGVTVSGHEVSFWGDGNVLKLDCSGGCTAL